MLTSVEKNAVAQLTAALERAQADLKLARTVLNEYAQPGFPTTSLFATPEVVALLKRCAEIAAACAAIPGS